MYEFIFDIINLTPFYKKLLRDYLLPKNIGLQCLENNYIKKEIDNYDVKKIYYYDRSTEQISSGDDYIIYKIIGKSNNSKYFYYIDEFDPFFDCYKNMFIKNELIDIFNIINFKDDFLEFIKIDNI